MKSKIDIKSLIIWEKRKDTTMFNFILVYKTSRKYINLVKIEISPQLNFNYYKIPKYINRIRKTPIKLKVTNSCYKLYAPAMVVY